MPPRKKTVATKKRRASAPRRRATRPVGTASPRRSSRRLELSTSSSAVQARMMAERAKGRTIGFVPTMGALHAGHAALLDEARRRADLVVCSVFVNPKQFGPSEDLSRYPRRLEEDRALCEACGVDVLFAPGVDEVYPPGFDTQLSAGRMASLLEGAARPGHFDGVLTVVALLFSVVQPHFAVFGEKDYQQLALIRRMVRDLRMTVEVVPMPVVRDVDGLALSSRNAYLSAAERPRATALYRALMAAQDEVQRGVVDTARLVAAARAVLEATPGLTVDYVEVRDPRSLEPLATLDRDARVLLAARLGSVRLIDNGPVFAGVRYPR
ncbi:MAG: pantoate--beta-alanine ligase [Deltaproteobacteria bacterium]|nr:pantoate--beta-alanine ligase [Deltaproteobacteria bacterium]